jgi:adenosylcobinamide kinase/adenosylcobinamide-phosphate guanylyltransferase
LGKKILITGGIKSGKSAFALELARKIERGAKFFIATARRIDREMEEKIERHQKERGSHFRTKEAPIHLGNALREVKHSTAVIDCLTLWLSNLFFELKEEEKLREVESLIEELNKYVGNAIIVTNEVGWGIIPADEISRSYQSELGSLNQRIAEICDEVYVLISGIALKVK